MTKVIACIDGSIYTQSVCDHAAWVARGLGGSVDLLHVLGRRQVTSVPTDFTGSLAADAQLALLTELAQHDEQHAKLAQQRGRLILDEAKARLEAAGVTSVTTRLRNGDLVETLAEDEQDAALVVVGKRGEAADFAKLHLGSNVERIARASRRPLLVAARAFREPRRMAIAFDGGPSANKAVEHVAASRVLKGLECHLLTIGSGERKQAELETAAERLRAAGYVVKASLLPGEPEEVIAQQVETQSIDLLIMGAYGHSRIRTFIIGSTTAEMLRSCKVPVLMFR